MLLSVPFPCLGFEVETVHTRVAHLNEQGMQLRAEIETAYRRLKSAKQLVPGHRGNDIGDIIRKFMPVGTSFDDAESILRSAGFTVGPRPSLHAAGDRPDKYHVSAFIKSLDRVNFFSNVEVVVSLGPKAPGDYSTIQEISAGIFTTSL